MDVLALYEGCLRTWLDRVSAVSRAHWERPTPSARRTVRELVNHVVLDDLWSIPLLEGALPSEIADLLQGDVLGDDPDAAARAVAAVARHCVRHSVPDGGIVFLPTGVEDCEDYVQRLAAHHLIHAWDLATALGTDPGLDPELVRAVSSWYSFVPRPRRAARLIDADPEEGDALAVLLTQFGRDAAWSPEGQDVIENGRPDNQFV
jgi:uncharacterized protein (TIGR03086 family)